MRAAGRALLGMAAVATAGGCIGRNYPDGGGIVGQLNREVIALQMRLEQAERRLESCGESDGPPDVVYQRMHTYLAGAEATVARTGRITEITMPASYVFGSDIDNVRQEAAMALDMVASSIQGRPGYRIVVEGHTSPGVVSSTVRGKFPDNWALSAGWARAVVATMVDEYGVPPEQVTLVAKAGSEPVEQGDTPAAREANERVLLIVVPPGVRP